ncbi:hypothetical protein EYS14_00140 [Alteromonadaceae bacterium M269]|nr:hypothetical protein EYS14_00140 [Alteromonadaceae bacterium M269]
MNIKYYLNKFLFFLTPFVLVILLYLYGGSAEYFDNIYIAALCVSILFCWADKDTFGALIVLLGYWLGSEVLFAVPDKWPYWLLIYSGCLALSIYYLHHITAKILLGFILFTVGAEIYWLSTEYADKPRMIYWVGLMSLTVWLRQLLFNRIFIMDEYFGYSGGKVALDGNVGDIFFGYYVLVTLMTLEFFIRHILRLGDMLFVYNLFTPVSTLISALTLAVIYMHYFYNQSKKHLSA